MTRVILIRHGQSEANLLDIIAGNLDLPLTELGRKQAEATADFLSSYKIDAVYASDLLRATETGMAIAARHGLDVVRRKDFREIFAGEWEGRQFSSLQNDPQLAEWKSHIGTFRFPGGESVQELTERMRRGVETAVAEHPGQTVCIATHATPVRVMEAVWTNMPPEGVKDIPWVSNASVTIGEYDDNGIGHLVERDIHDHLRGMVSRLPDCI